MFSSSERIELKRESNRGFSKKVKRLSARPILAKEKP